MKLKALFLIAACLWGYGFCVAQSGKNGAFELQPAEPHFDTLKPKDTIAVRNQINYALTIVRNYPDSVRYLLEDALKKSLYLKYYPGIATANADLGYINTIEGNFRTAIGYYQKALPYAVKGLKTRTSLAMFYTCMGAPYFHLGLYDSMYFYSSKGEDIVKDIQSKTAAEAIDVSSIYNNIGLLWGGVNNFDKALTYLLKAKHVLEVFKKNPEKLVLTKANIHSNIGLVYYEQHKIDSAQYFLETSLRADPDNPLSIISLAKILIDKHQPEEAEAMLRKAIRYTDVAHNYSSGIYARAVLGILLFQQKQYKEAEALLNKVVEASGNQGDEDLNHTYHAYKTLAELKSLHGDYKNAFLLEKKSLELLDSIKIKEKMLSFYDLEFSLQTANKDKAMAKNTLLLAQTENQLQQRNFWIAAISLCFAIFILLLISYYRYSQTKHRLHQKELDELEKEREINNLRATIKGEEKERARLAREIHDGIMVQLSTIKMGMKVIPDFCRNKSAEDFFKTDYYRELVNGMESATAELRSTAHNLMPDMLLQGGLSDALLYFCNTIKKNTGIYIDYQQHGHVNGLGKEFELSVYRIVQELLQNVIKHARASKVMLQVTLLSENILTVTIEDDGIGFDPQAYEGGMGLTSIYNRLKIMNGHMDVQSDAVNGTSIHIEFELIPLKDSVH